MKVPMIIPSNQLLSVLMIGTMDILTLKISEDFLEIWVTQLLKRSFYALLEDSTWMEMQK